jgi:ATP-dependent helicase Lhr and Lhr-like helicase
MSPKKAATKTKPVQPATQPLLNWFTQQGWQPFPFQQATWQAYLHGQSGLVHATTGTGKTYAVWGGPLLKYLSQQEEQKQTNTNQPKQPSQTAPPLKVLWITPLRSLAADTEKTLIAMTQGLNIPWLVERRTGDTPASLKNRQRERLPTCLITTPESMSLLLARNDARQQFAQLEAVIVDEWHELLGTKRGVQAELCLARLRSWNPNLVTWGLSATLGNLPEAMRVLMGQEPAAFQSHPQKQGVLIQGSREKVYHIDSLLPETIERFPWAGHLGVRLLKPVLALLEAGQSSLVFTNTRAQTEIWYQAVLAARPDWAGQIALHHGSLDSEVRAWVENGLRTGSLKCVVCTSSLDLGVDFSPVDQVLQIGSPKGVGRLLQRAGRSGHQPGATSQVICIPTHALELVEFAATRQALAEGRIEARAPLSKPLDVLVQHAVTIALGSGFRPDELFAEVKQSAAYANLTTEEWEWVLGFIHHGGNALKAYPDYQRTEIVDGVYRVTNPKIARQHRMSIGTITSDAAMSVQYLRGARLGTVEEAFISRLKPGDVFTFSGKFLELVRVYNLTAYVKPAKNPKGPIPRWGGGRMPLSSELSLGIRKLLEEARDGIYTGPEMENVRPILELQNEWSIVPRESELLIEVLKSKEGHHLFVFPFAGRLVHEGLASLFAYRLSQIEPLTFTMAMNDYGIELLSAKPAPLEAAIKQDLFSTQNLAADIAKSLNAVEMAKRQFREVARISGLLFTGMPGAPKSNRHLQASAGMLYDVFAEYDPDNLLLAQAKREVLERQLESTRLEQTLLKLQTATIQLRYVERPTPLAFPLLVDRLREKLSSEKLADRVQRMQIPLEKAASKKKTR